MSKYRDLLPVIVETTGAVMPEGFDSWGIKSVRPDLETTRGFRWALPGGLNISSDALDLSNTSACPSRPGDGLCVATTWRGMASGCIPARTLLLVAYRAADVAGRDPNKLRINGVVASVALVDGERFIREHGKGMDLQGADLRGMDLRGADLKDADLRGACLQDADLQDADLQGAYLQDANLHDASLRDACLHGANLRDAYLQGVDLRRADLRGVDLQGAYLQYADLRDALWTIGDPPPNGWELTDTGRLTICTGGES